MARTEPFVTQLAGLPLLMEALSHHRAMSIDLLAAQVAMPEPTVRQLLLTYYLTDEPAERRGWLPPLRFVDEAGEDVDPSSAPLVRLTSDIVTNDLAFRYSPVDTWATSYRIARDRLHLEPGNSLLEGALEKLKVAIDDEMRPSRQIMHRPIAPSDWYRATQEHHRVAIRYSRAWRPGITERVVDPYRVVRTRRGWEVDAGPPDDNGRLRTYLLPGVVAAEFLTETFEPPEDLVEMLARQRRTTAIEFVVPPEEVWVVERLAERIEVVKRDDVDVLIRAHLLEPVRERVAEILVTAGPEAMVVDKDLMDAGRDLARALLEHHRP